MLSGASMSPRASRRRASWRVVTPLSSSSAQAMCVATTMPGATAGFAQRLAQAARAAPGANPSRPIPVSTLSHTPSGAAGRAAASHSSWRGLSTISQKLSRAAISSSTGSNTPSISSTGARTPASRNSSASSMQATPKACTTPSSARATAGAPCP